MIDANDIVGKTFGRLKILSIDRIERFKSKKKNSYNKIVKKYYFGTRNTYYYKCKCKCGKISIGKRSDLFRGDKTSCGCKRIEVLLKRNKEVMTTHGMTKSKEYSTWCAMKRRCYKKTNPKYKDYGGRGILVCDRWKDSFENFLKDMGKKPSKHHSIDRIDNEKGYFKANCQWATAKQQANNKRNSKQNKRR